MKKIVFSGSIANSLEWYDYALYAHFSSIFSKLFFPSYDANVSLLATYGVFAVGFLMRPVGAILFGTIGDLYGRKLSLSLAILLMSIPTALFGLLPTYEQIGFWAPLLLTILRLLQGLSLGGALIGSVSYIVEHAKPQHRGLAGSASMFSLCLGFMAGSLVATLLAKYLSEEDLLNYGWRIPFLLGILTTGMSYYIKNHTSESPEFEEAKKSDTLVKSPFKESIKNYKSVILTSIAINSFGSVGFYALAVYVPGYLQTFRGLSLSESAGMETMVMMIIMFSVVLAGWISDLIGRRKFFSGVIICASILIWPICYYLGHGDYMEIFAAQIIFALLVAFWIGPEPTLHVEMYPTKIRNTAVSIAYNLGCTIFGGTAPLILELLYGKLNTIQVVSFCLVFVSILSAIGIYFYADRSKR